jgi:DNA-binding MarR family transcriptional regulator
MDAPDMSPFEFAIALERARHRIVVLLDGAVWHLGATFAGTRALRVIAEAYGGWTHAGEIGRRMGITRQAAATLVKRHEAAGHVEVVDEGWAKSVRITPAGRVHLQECIRGMDRALGRLRYVPEVDLVEVGDVLHRVDEVLDGQHGPMWVPDL